jgi:hypothetical protein
LGRRATESLPTSVLLCRDRLKEERKEKCLAVSDDAPMLHPIPHSPMNFFKTLAMVGLVGVGMVYGESVDSNLRQELSGKLDKAISTKDTKIFNECFSYDELTESGKKAVRNLQHQLFGWNKAYVRIDDPVLGKVDGIPNLNGKYIFDIHFRKDDLARGFGYDFYGGVRKGKPVVLSPAIWDISPPTPQ